MIISISGKIGSGKDTVAQIIKETTPHYNWQVKKFAGKLKQIASILTAIPIEKFEDQEFKKTYLGKEWEYEDGSPMTVRDLLQLLGTEAMRNGLHTDAWVNALFADYIAEDEFTEYYNGTEWATKPIGLIYPNWLITDTRFPNELDAVISKGAVTIKVERDVDNTIGVLHASETALNHVTNWDYVINNNGSMEDLRQQVSDILNELKLIRYKGI
jgi:hypothetical protein